MGQPLKQKTGVEIQAAMDRLQLAKTPIFQFIRTAAQPGKKTKVVYEIETIEPDTRRGALRWKELHNNPSVRVIAEKDYMSHRDGLKTVIRYAITTEEPDPEDLIEDLMPE
jgi:hypothetical protein